MVKSKKPAGWRVDGCRVYSVKGVRKSRRKTYKSKEEALASLKRRGKRSH